MMRRLALVPLVVWADLAWALDGAQQRSGGSGVGLCCTIVLIALFRSGGVDWGRSVGAALIPGVFGWFIWRDREIGTGTRWIALIFATAQVAGFLLIAGLGVFVATRGGNLSQLGSTAPSTERVALYRAGFVRRCSENASAEVCACIETAAVAERDENDLKQLGFGIESGGLERWLGETRKKCGGSGATPNAPARTERVPRNDESDPLGLNPKCTITSQPSGAKVFIQDQERGVTPLETRLKAVTANSVRVELTGFFPETRVLTPNTNEVTSLVFDLRAASRLRLKTEPPGASARIGEKTEIAASPGVSGPLEPGEVEVLITLPGYEAVTKKVTLGASEEALELTLTRGAKVSVESTPEGAEVRLDGVLLGLAPLDVFLPLKGKHSVVVSKEGWSTVKKVFTKVKPDERLVAKLVDTELSVLRAKVKKTRAAYDKANLVLEKLQAKRDVLPNPPDSLLRKIDDAEKSMERTSAAYEAAETALRAAEERRQ